MRPEALSKIGDPQHSTPWQPPEDDSRDVRLPPFKRPSDGCSRCGTDCMIRIENEDLRIPALQALREIAGTKDSSGRASTRKIHEIAKTTADPAGIIGSPTLRWSGGCWR